MKKALKYALATFLVLLAAYIIGYVVFVFRIA